MSTYPPNIANPVYGAYTQAGLASADLEGRLAIPRGGRTVADSDLVTYLANNAVVNAKDFGAKGDGTTDDTAALLAACLSTGVYDQTTMQRTVTLPAGTYVISAPIYVRAGTIVRGAGTTLTKISATHSGAAFVLGGSSSGSDSSGNVCGVSDLWIASSTVSSGIDATFQSGWFARNLWLTAPVGILAGGTDGLIQGCTGDIGLGSGIMLDVTGSQIRIANCESYGGSYGVRLRATASNVVVSGCAFNYAKFASILFASGSTLTGVTITGSQFVTSTNSSYYDSTNTHLLIQGTLQMLTVTGCLFRSARAYSIRCDTTAQATSDHLISANQFQDDNGNSISYAVASSVYIRGNVFRNCLSNPIVLVGVTRSRITGNDFLNSFTGGSPATEPAKGLVNIDTAGSDHVLSLNSTDSTTRYVASMTTSTQARSFGNRSGYSAGDVIVTSAGSVSVNERCATFGSNINPSNETLNGRSIRSDSAVPTAGTWAVGDIVYHSVPASSGFIGWVCTSAGTPGTWKTFGAIS